MLTNLFDIRAYFIAICLVCYYPLSINASPWVDPGDERTRHHLQVLVDSHLINTPITAWPLMWSAIKSELDAINATNLTPEQTWSYSYVAHELRKAMEPVYTTSQSHANSLSAHGITGFDSDARNDAEIQTAVTLTGDTFAMKLSGTYVKSPNDLKKGRADGSYLAMLWGDWAFGIGSIDRWWGPGWQSSLILSQNARPSPGLFITRNHSKPFEWPILKWLGPWQLTTFMNELESQRAIPNAKLWGMRVNFRPHRSLEIGLSRTAMWSGEGRPSDFKTFQNLLIGNDNRATNGEFERNDSDITEENEPGNQLGGVDIRWSYSLLGLRGAAYAQFIGEDEAGGAPSRGIGLAGIELNRLLWGTQHRLALESQNTTMSFYDNEKRFNSTYEHSIYRSGYRYYGRPIGSSTDNDTEMLTLLGQHLFENGHSLHWRIAHIRSNIDSSDRGGDGGSVFGDNAVDTRLLTLAYKRPLGERLFLEFGFQHYDEPLSAYDEELDSGVYGTLRSYW